MAYFGIAAFVFARITQPRLRANGEVIHRASVDVFGAAINALGGVEGIELRSTYPFFLTRFTAARLNIAKAERRTIFLTDLPKHVMEIMFVIGLAGLVTILFATNPTSAALGQVALFAAAGYRTLPSVVRVLATVGMMRGADPVVIDVVRDVLDARSSTASADVRPVRTALDEELRIEHVQTHLSRWGPSRAERRQHHRSARSLAGPRGRQRSRQEHVGRPDPRAERPDEGAITADGADIQGDLPAWRAGIGLVPQEVWFTDGSLRENITFGVEADDVDMDALGAGC